MNDLKKIFTDILFEPEEKVELEEIIKEKNKKETAGKSDRSPFKASEILYRKSGTAFINYDEKKSASDTIDSSLDDGEYEFSANISPMYGVINDGEKKSQEKAEVNEKLVKRPANDYLDIVPSPIYGYGYKEDNETEFPEYEEASEKIENDVMEEDDEEEIHRIFSDSDDDHSRTEKTGDISLFDIFGDEE